MQAAAAARRLPGLDRAGVSAGSSSERFTARAHGRGLPASSIAALIARPPSRCRRPSELTALTRTVRPGRRAAGFRRSTSRRRRRVSIQGRRRAEARRLLRGVRPLRQRAGRGPGSRRASSPRTPATCRSSISPSTTSGRCCCPRDDRRTTPARCRPHQPRSQRRRRARLPGRTWCTSARHRVLWRRRRCSERCDLRNYGTAPGELRLSSTSMPISPTSSRCAARCGRAAASSCRRSRRRRGRARLPRPRRRSSARTRLPSTRRPSRLATTA